MRGLALSLLLLVAGWFAAPPAAAEPRTAAAASAETAFVPSFAPPLGQPLRYRLTRERITPATTERTVFDQQILFKRGGDGFVMQITTLRLTLGGRSYAIPRDLARFPPEVRAAFLPMAIELGGNGHPLRLRDWPRLRRLLVDISSLAAREEADPARRKTAEAVLRGLMERYAALSAEEAVQHMVRGWPPILAELGAPVELGREDRSATQALTPLSAEPIDYDTAATWTLAADGTMLHLARRSVPSAESLRAVVAGLAAVARQSAPRSKTMRPEKLERAFTAVKVSTQIDIDFDRATGMVRKAVLDKTVTAQSQTGIDRITIEAM